LAITVAQKGNPIRVTGTTDTSTVIHDGRESIYIGRIVWVAPATAADKLDLKTSHGNFIAEFVCGADGITEEREINGYFDDIYCTDMDSGTLYIYTR